MPAMRGEGWQLTPVLSLDAIRLFVSLGGRLERDLRSASLPAAVATELVERINVHTLHAGPKECLDSAGALAQELARELGVPVGPGAPKDKRDRWGDCSSPAAPIGDPTAARPASSSCASSRSRPASTRSDVSVPCGVMTATVSRAR